MIVEVTMATDKLDDRDYLKIEVDGKTVFKAMDGEPEDNTLCRNFNDCFGIGELIRDAFHAGKEGGACLLITKKIKWEDV